MEGVVELAESIFQTSVRLGIPSKFQGMESILTKSNIFNFNWFN